MTSAGGHPTSSCRGGGRPGHDGPVLWATLAGHWLTPYTLEPVQWLLLFWLLTRWVRVRDDRLLLALGVVVGIAAETRFQVLALCAVLVGAVLVAGPRALLRRPMLWAGAGIAAVLAAPTLVWQAVHGWPQLRMGPIVVAEAGAGLQRRREAGRRRWSWTAWPANALAAVLAGGLLLVSPTLVSPTVPDRIARDTAAAYRALPPEQRGRTAVGSSGDDLRPFFTEVRRVGRSGDTELWLATGRTGPWSLIWPRMRTLSVG